MHVLKKVIRRRVAHTACFSGCEVAQQAGAMGIQEPELLSNFQLCSSLQGHSRAVASVKFSPTGELLATAAADQTARLWNHATGQELRLLQGHTQGINDVCWSPGGNYLCTASDDHTLKFWDAGELFFLLLFSVSISFCFSRPSRARAMLPSLTYAAALRINTTQSAECMCQGDSAMKYCIGNSKAQR